jgi:transcriptional regulator with GAF, ATPase, and Fis domain
MSITDGERGLSIVARYEALIRVSEALRTYHDRDTLFRSLARNLRRVVEFSFLGLALYDEQTRVVEPHVLEDTGERVFPPQLTSEEQLTYWVLQHQKPLVIPVVENETRFAQEMAYLRGQNASSVCCLPLTTPQRRVGMLLAASRRPHVYVEEDLAFLSLVANQVALAIDDALNHDALQSSLVVERERLRQLNASDLLLRALSPALDVREVFHQVSEIAKQVIPHDMLRLMAPTPDWTGTVALVATDEALDSSETYPILDSHKILLHNWDHQIVPDIQEDDSERTSPPGLAGYRSVLRVSTRVRGEVIAGLGFYSRQPNAFNPDHLVVAHRIADHLALALSHARLADEKRLSATLEERTANLELLDGLLNTLSGVLDVRQVFEQVSAVARKVIAHDMLTLLLVTPDPDQAVVYAVSGREVRFPTTFKLAEHQKALLADRWEYLIHPDMQADPLESRQRPALAGYRGRLLVPVRIQDEFVGALDFLSYEPNRYSKADVLVARRIADHLALALSHHRLADEVRRHEELRVRTTNLDLLDELLAALIDSGDLPDVFGRISTIAGKVLAHDAVLLFVQLPDGQRSRIYASSGARGQVPQETAVPPELLAKPDWEFDIFDDLAELPYYALLVNIGFRSLLRVPIRLDGRFAGALVFLAKGQSAFKQTDVPVARRMADRLALTLARDRELAASKRADDAAARAAKLEARVKALTEELDTRTGYRRVIGDSRQWKQVLTMATQVAATDTTVLLLGESGTGKEVVARFVHRASPRATGPFIALNCAALPEQLLEAELFGYERGAFTGATQSKPGQLEQAAGGTLFLDEVAEMSPSAQAKFLRVLQEREFQRLGGTRVLRTDARIVAATNRDLTVAIARGIFREDLYYRLSVFEIALPRLRDRPEDILPLSQAFLHDIGHAFGRPPAGISREARQRLTEYYWPGNVRQLRNTLERAAILCEGGLITSEHLSLPPRTPDAAPAVRPPPVDALSVVTSSTPTKFIDDSAVGVNLGAMERSAIEKALVDSKHNKSRAAKMLGLTRTQLYVRLRKYGLE